MRNLVADIVGATSGIGPGITHVFTAASLQVATYDIRKADLDDTVDQVRTTGGKAHGLCDNVPDCDATGRAAAEIDPVSLGADILANNPLVIPESGSIGFSMSPTRASTGCST
ncbi:hypothetical protein CHELA1G11_20416 [Hyphomicrobiales bacterium]|nr:hypothetical protein CHELA1G11_20416 [Hyphomicrobiales bacterium]CAH1690105.1 hypothetical protein CHELA1G2_20729 [Hyphomicrobiales bacterium]